MKRVVINIRASKNISGLVKVSVTSPAGLMKFLLNVEPWAITMITLGPVHSVMVAAVVQRPKYNNSARLWSLGLKKEIVCFL